MSGRYLYPAGEHDEQTLASYHRDAVERIADADKEGLLLLVQS